MRDQPYRTKGATRVAGVLLVLCGAILGAIGTYLLAITLEWRLPDWMPPELRVTPSFGGTEEERLVTPPGLSALFLIGMGSVAGLLGLGMAVLGRRSRVLFVLFLAFAAVFMAAGVIVTLQSGGTLRRLNG